MFWKYIKYDTYFQKGSEIQLRLNHKHSSVNNLKKNVILHFKQHGVNIFRIDTIKNSVYIECDNPHWRKALEPIVDKSIKISHYSQFTHNNKHHKKMHYFICISILNDTKHTTSILEKNLVLLQTLLSECNVYIKDNKYINVVVPNFLNVSEIKKKLSFSGKFTVRYYNPQLSHYKQLTSIESIEKKPKGVSLFNNISFPNLIKRVVGNSNGYVVANLHPSILEKVNKLSFKNKNCMITFDMDNKLLLEQEMFHDCLQVENVIAVIKNNKLRSDIINLLNLPLPLDRFTIQSTKTKCATHNSNMKLLLLLLTLIIMIGLAILTAKTKLRKLKVLGMSLVLSYLNYLYLFVSLSMFYVSFTDISLLIILEYASNKVDNHYKKLTIILMHVLLSIVMLFGYCYFINYMWIFKHYWYYLSIILVGSLLGIN